MALNPTSSHPSGGGGASPVSTAVVNVSSAQILAMGDDNVTLIAAPGAGEIIVLLSVVFEYVPGATGYTTSSGLIAVQTGNGTTQVAVGDSLLEGNTDTLVWPAYPVTSNSSALLSHYANQPVIMFDDTASPTLGDGTMTVTVIYSVIDA